MSEPSPPPTQPLAGREPGRAAAVATVALPVLILLTLVGIYLISPRFYLDYILEALKRERQAVEIATFSFLFLGGIVMIAVVARQCRRRRELAEPGSTAALVIHALVLLACFFVAGEEIDWGDSWGLWGEQPPKGDLDALNVHNTSSLPIKNLGSAFLIAVFFILPGLWAIRDRLNLPQGLRPAIAPWPVVVAMAIAFAWRLVKNVYVAYVGEDHLGQYGDGGVYWDFIEQINEHKELLIGVALFLYALWALGRVKARIAR